MMLANQEPADCGTETVGLILNESDLMKERLRKCMVVAKVLLEMVGQMFVVGEVDAI